MEVVAVHNWKGWAYRSATHYLSQTVNIDAEVYNIIALRLFDKN